STVGEAWSLESLGIWTDCEAAVGAWLPGARLRGSQAQEVNTDPELMRSARHRALEIERMKWFISSSFYFGPGQFPRISEPLFITWENENRTGKPFSPIPGWTRLGID
ncbi:hypothetical protein QBC32DRAFT_199471, partial [Pseudoneurospora amorphoporcata]